MKLLLTPLALLLAAGPLREEVTIEFAPEEGTVLKRTFVAEAEYHLADMSASVGGEPLERNGDLPEYGMSFVEHIEVTDTLKSVAGGRPTELVRKFDDLSQENTDRGTDAEGETQELQTTLESDLEGRAVRFQWDDDAESYDVGAADGEDLDDEIASVLAEDMDLRLVLPGHAVEVGDDWELDPKLYLAFMWPSGLLDFHVPDDEETDDQGRAMSLQTIERLEGSGTAKLEEVREEDGVRVAVIHLELTLTTGSEGDSPAIEEEGELVRPAVTTEVEIERSLTGTILWDLEHGHALSAELECVASRLHTEKASMPDEEGNDVELEQSRLLEGTIKYTATIERE